MAVGAEPGTIVTILVATGILSAVTETVRWYLTGRGRAKVDQAKIVQGMALDLLRPLHDELDQANLAMANLRKTVQSLDAELESVLGWALIARALLDHHHIEYPEVPQALIHRSIPPGGRGRRLHRP
jgi:hypothetical protein